MADPADPADPADLMCFPGVRTLAQPGERGQGVSPTELMQPELEGSGLS